MGGRVAQIADVALELGIAVGETAIRKAPGTSPRIQGTTAKDALRSWILIDLEVLDFFEALVAVRLADSPDMAYRALAGVPGVSELLRTGPRLAYAIVIYDRRSEERALRARIEEFAHVDRWEVIQHHDRAPALATWRTLARRAADRERLLS
jgi:hypothetical protein